MADVGRPRRVAFAFASVASLFAAAILTLATPGIAAAAEPVRATIGVIGPIGSLDPSEATSAVAREVMQLQYPALTTFAAVPTRHPARAGRRVERRRPTAAASSTRCVPQRGATGVP